MADASRIHLDIQERRIWVREARHVRQAGNRAAGSQEAGNWAAGRQKVGRPAPGNRNVGVRAAGRTGAEKEICWGGGRLAGWAVRGATVAARGARTARPRGFREIRP
ncbi:hypothetical protein GCM10009555_043720 [Acrocarpospora macrocephala]|uniref:Uncharacterized protein n=1 Tax=Acrocarpospora macrocephala TaxID=150177 RepID=A0A5M3WD21_9ACTN|nr:hypothetical protein Amac_005600 [Acrocarpospora macrocephala]